MRLLYVWDSEYPWDVRTEKVCLSLSQGGHDVFITSRNRRRLPRTESLKEGVVERLPSEIWPKFDWLSFPVFFNPLWLAHIRRLITRHKIELVIVRDLPLAPAALLVAPKRCPVILDMAENYPAMIADIWTDGRQGWLDGLVRNPRAVAMVEKYVVSRVAHSITVVKESKDRLIRLGVPQGAVSIVSNTPPSCRVKDLVPRQPGSVLRVVYLGLMERHRGIIDVMAAASILAQLNEPVRFDLIGDGRDYEDFQMRARELGLGGDYFVFHGRLPHEAAIQIVEAAHVGIVPHHATASWNTTISNKLFDYMAAGLAVVTSDAGPSRRVVEETGAGLVYNSGDPAGLANAVQACQDPLKWEVFRKAGQAAIVARYNWEFDASTLLDVIKAVKRPGSDLPPSPN